MPIVWVVDPSFSTVTVYRPDAKPQLFNADQEITAEPHLPGLRFAVAELFEAAGARLISWYLTLGHYDWLIIAEAPDEPTMISAVLAAAAGGSLSDITTTVALTASDTTKAFQRAGELALKFRSAGRADYYGVGIGSEREIGEA